MIRKARPEDASRLAEILIFAKRTAYRSIFNNDEVSFGEMQVLPLALQYRNSPQMLENIFVYNDTFAKGMINIAIEDNVLEIKELYVDPFFHNNGIGGALLSHITEYAKELGIKKLALSVLEKNENAKSFYVKHGFVITNDRRLQESTTEYLLKCIKAI